MNENEKSKQESKILNETDPNIIPKEFNRLLTVPPVISNNQNYHNMNLYQQQQQFNPYVNYDNNLPFYNTNLYNQNNGAWTNYQFNNRQRNFPFNNFNNNNMPAIPMIVTKMAEDKMRPTFKSIEMILETFHSLNMILDSTYSTLHGTFRTIIGVADHLIFIRNHLVELALFPRLTRTLINFIRWIFKFLGLNHIKVCKIFEQKINEKIWQESMSSSNMMRNPILESSEFNGIDSSTAASSSLWPVMAFFSLILGAPYIVWKLLGAAGQIPLYNQPDWTTKNGNHFIAIGLQNFNARNQNELSFRKGQLLYIKPESLQTNSKWLVACTINNDDGTNDFNKNPIQIGVIPLNLVKLLMNK